MAEDAMQQRKTLLLQTAAKSVGMHNRTTCKAPAHLCIPCRKPSVRQNPPQMSSKLARIVTESGRCCAAPNPPGTPVPLPVTTV